MQIQCSCGVGLQIEPDLVGRKVRCPECRQIILVKDPSQPANAPPQQAAQHARPAFESRVVQLPGVQRRSSSGWKKKKSGPNRELVIGLSVGLGSLGLIAIIVAVALRFSSLDSSLENTSTVAKQSVSEPEPELNKESADIESKSPTENSPLAQKNAKTPATNSSLISEKSGSSSKKKTSVSADNSVTRESSSSAGENRAASSEPMNLVDLIEFVEPSVVRIDVNSAQGESIGSGVFVERDLIVTNYHVVQGASRVKLTTSNGEEFRCPGFLHVDPLKDLAIISIDANDQSMPVLPIARQLPRKGEDVAAFGSPMGFDFSATQGTVASIRSGAEIREVLINLAGIDVYSFKGYSEKTNWIQMTAAISGGNSGGPLTNMRGELVGINTFTNPAGQNLNFASTFEEVVSVLESARESQLKNFAQLPRQRITIELPSMPAVPERDIAGTPGRPKGKRFSFQYPPQSFPFANPPGNSRSGRDVGNQPTRNVPPSNGGKTITIESPRVLTPEESEALAMRMKGTMTIELEETPKFFESHGNPAIVRSFSTGNAAIVDLALSEDGKFLAAANSDGTVHVFDNQQKGKLLYRIESEHRLFRRVAFVSGPTRLVTGRDRGRGDFAHFRIPETGEIKKGVEQIGQQRLTILAASSDGRTIFARDQFVSKLWRYALMDDSVKEMPVHPFSGDIREGFVDESCATFSPNNRILWAGTNTGRIVAYTGNASSIFIRATGTKRISNFGIPDIAITPDGEKIVAACEDGQTYIVDVSGRNWRSSKLGKESDAEMIGVSVSRDGSMIATSSADRTVTIYRANERTKIKDFKLPTLSGSIEFFGDDRFLVAGCKDGGIYIYRAN